MARRFWLGYPPTHKSFAPYVMAIGQAAIAWNGLHEAMRSLLTLLLDPIDVPTTNALWYSIRSDRQQRLIFANVAKSELEIGNISDEIYSKLKWLTDQADKLADARDNAIHAPIVSWAGDVLPFAHQGNPRATRLVNKPLLQEYRWCRDTALALTDFCIRLEFALSQIRPYALPETPALPNRGQKKGSQHQPRRSHPK